MPLERRPEIIGMGKARGTVNITNEDIANKISEARIAIGKKPISTKVIDEMSKRTGIYERGWVNEGEAAAHMAAQSIRMALDMAGVSLEEIKAINVATGLPDYLGVPTGIVIMKEMGGPTNIRTDDTSAACPGFIHALGRTFSDLDSKNYGAGSPQIVVASEPASRGIDPYHSDTYVVFGDASGAFVMENRMVDPTVGPKAKFIHRTDPDYLYDLYVPVGGSRKRTDKKDLDEHLNSIHMKGPVIKEQAIRRLIEITEEILHEVGVSKDDIDLFIFHQANKEIIDEVTKKLEIPDDKTYVNIQRYGNTSAATIPVGMTEAHKDGMLKNGDKVVIGSFGAGINYGGGYMTLQGLPKNDSNPNDNR